jgi:hypothetical protein
MFFRRVIALTDTTAATDNPSKAVLTYRRNLQAR